MVNILVLSSIFQISFDQQKKDSDIQIQITEIKCFLNSFQQLTLKIYDQNFDIFDTSDSKVSKISPIQI